MQFFKQFWQRPYVYTYYKRLRWRQGVLYGIFVTLFLGFFSPFQINLLPQGLWVVASLFGLVTLLVIWLLAIFIAFLPKVFDEQRWTVGKEIIINIAHIACIGIGNYLLFLYLTGAKPHFLNLLLFELYTLAIGVFPISAWIGWRELQQRTFYEKSAAQMQIKNVFKDGVDIADQPIITKNLETDLMPNQICLVATSASDNFEIEPNNLLFLQAADNYVELNFTTPKLKKHIMRQTLKELESQLTTDSRFFRCHKSFIVNCNRVVKISGNAQGFKLHFNETEKTVPVSRQYNQSLHLRFTNGHKP